MSAADTLALANEARTKGQWLKWESINCWYTPDEVIDAIERGEDWVVNAPLQVAPLPNMRNVWPDDMPPENRTACEDALGDACLDLLGTYAILVVVLTIGAMMMGWTEGW